jgi:hypothetical protein
VLIPQVQQEIIKLLKIDSIVTGSETMVVPEMTDCLRVIVSV